MMMQTRKDGTSPQERTRGRGREEMREGSASFCPRKDTWRWKEESSDPECRRAGGRQPLSELGAVRVWCGTLSQEELALKEGTQNSAAF